MADHEHTEQQLRTAWADRKKPGWPPAFEQVMQDPWLARLVGMQADLNKRRQASARAMAATATQHVARTSFQPTPRTPPVFDRKRAASGEREDD